MNGEPLAQPALALSPRSALDLLRRFREVRAQTESLCQPLEIEDYGLQPVPEVSPAKWHLAHTTWFFEQFVLGEAEPAYERFHPMYAYIFNSYYNQAGVFHPRVARGDLSRPTVREVYDFRAHVDERVRALIERAGEDDLARLAPIVSLGLNHEQQHQELLLTDVKYSLSRNPLEPTYRPIDSLAVGTQPVPLGWLELAAGLYDFGYAGDSFHFDNEAPRHRVYLNDFSIANRPVTNAEYLAFMEDGGYQRAELWLSDGWDAVRREGWQAPLYWHQREGAWVNFTLAGTRPVDPNEPVCHVSHYEADAYARWTGRRLPTEFEWELAAASLPAEGNFVESGRLQPAPVSAGHPSLGFYGDTWEWTQSAYLPYPGFEPLPGAAGEYNGKFMSGQIVLRGGSCATPRSHIRATYRNFFQPHHRWQFMGFRLASS